MLCSDGLSNMVDDEKLEEILSGEGTEEELAEMAKQEQIRQVTAQINDLKVQIAASDYKVIKTYEYSLLGEQAEYDMETVHAERQNLRDQINALETQLTELTAE